MKQQIPKSVLDVWAEDQFKYLHTHTLVAFSMTCTQIFEITKVEKGRRLLQAVVKRNLDDVTRLLRADPDLLLCSDRPFQVALCAGDDRMCEVMKKIGFEKLKNGQDLLTEQFNEIFPKGFEAHLQAQKENVFDFDDILQAITHATEDDVKTALRKEFTDNIPLHLALKNFRNEFTKKSKSESVFNPYHMLRAFEKYDTGNLVGKNKCDLFWRQVIGYVQRFRPDCHVGLLRGIGRMEDEWPLPKRKPIIIQENSGLGYDFADWGGNWTSNIVKKGYTAKNFKPILEHNNSSIKDILVSDCAWVLQRPMSKCKRSPCKL